jgi:hypothetical protein
VAHGARLKVKGVLVLLDELSGVGAIFPCCFIGKIRPEQHPQIFRNRGLMFMQGVAGLPIFAANEMEQDTFYGVMAVYPRAFVILNV